MDSEQRHELKENDLMAFFRNFKDWWNRHGTRTLGMILIAIALVLGYQWYSGRDARAREQAWTALASARTAEERQQVAQTYAGERPGLAGMALLAAADELYAQALFGSTNPNDMVLDANMGEQAKRNQLERAATLYQQVIDSASPTQPSILKLNARLGLGSVHETLGNWDQAREQYDAAWKQAGAYQTVSRIAQARLNDLDQRMQPITFPADPNVAAPNAAVPDEMPLLDDAAEPGLMPAPQITP